uniref:NADH-ubiquinone oxidoreductase chain 2 n=1 Tax=Trachys troglodytiformis TaxID=1244535 RepID=A0A343C3X2_9COLE|nr:NADH dehydrogenase subunit 2 [Trachys troglodytiformis]
MSNLYKITFTITMVSGTLITISSNSWLGMWMGLEINLLSIIPLMNNSNNPRASEASLKYFTTQALASTALLASVLIINSQIWINSNLDTTSMPEMLMVSSILMKTGAAPFHFWFPEVIEGCSWINTLILMTWQKIAPMTMLMYTNSSMLLVIAIIASVIVGSMMGLNQTSLRKILSYSSINHIGWMLSAILVAETVWIMYFTIYSLMNSMMIWMFYYWNSSHVNQLTMMSSFNPMLKSIFMLNFLSLGGTPPFIGFLPKWMVIQSLVMNQMYTTSLMLILTALITLYYYLRIALNNFVFNNPAIKPSMVEKPLKKKNFLTMNVFFLSNLIMYLGLFNLT